jgi:hypothetical protein
MDLKIRLGHLIVRALHAQHGGIQIQLTHQSLQTCERASLLGGLLAGGGLCGRIPAPISGRRDSIGLNAQENGVVARHLRDLETRDQLRGHLDRDDRIGARECVVLLYDVQDGAGAPAIFAMERHAHELVSVQGGRALNIHKVHGLEGCDAHAVAFVGEAEMVLLSICHGGFFRGFLFFNYFYCEYIVMI